MNTIFRSAAFWLHLCIHCTEVPFSLKTVWLIYHGSTGKCMKTHENGSLQPRFDISKLSILLWLLYTSLNSYLHSSYSEHEQEEPTGSEIPIFPSHIISHIPKPLQLIFLCIFSSFVGSNHLDLHLKLPQTLSSCSMFNTVQIELKLHRRFIVQQVSSGESINLFFHLCKI